MLYHILFPLSDQIGPLNVFRYLTFRSGGAVATAWLVSFAMGPRIIAWLRSLQPGGQPIRDDIPESHLLKKGTPTMGGFMMLLAIV
ncbi:MAG: phospho-N-acetylmuramoyl-pentapeptide-transferase, partial [Alphaproteobacteria bacterium]|nr:phospho-N-acetylmuramoyl-pentapeptide-transferase [Alphaproteobacteria bacterium]